MNNKDYFTKQINRLKRAITIVKELSDIEVQCKYLCNKFEALDILQTEIDNYSAKLIASA